MTPPTDEIRFGPVREIREEVQGIFFDNDLDAGGIDIHGEALVRLERMVQQSCPLVAYEADVLERCGCDEGTLHVCGPDVGPCEAACCDPCDRCADSPSPGWVVVREARMTAERYREIVMCGLRVLTCAYDPLAYDLLVEPSYSVREVAFALAIAKGGGMSKSRKHDIQRNYMERAGESFVVGDESPEAGAPDREAGTSSRHGTTPGSDPGPASGSPDDGDEAEEESQYAFTTEGQALAWAHGEIQRLRQRLRDAEPSVLQDDVRDLLLAAGLEHYARPVSPHRVVRDEVIPAIRALVKRAEVADERERRLRKALDWYAEKARSIAKYMNAGRSSDYATMAIVTELRLDEGGRARAALGEDGER